MATNWPQLVKPRACRSALCCLTAFSKLPRENNCNTCEKMLHTFIRLSLLWLNWFFDGTQSSLSGDSASYLPREPRKRPVLSLRIWTAVIKAVIYDAARDRELDCSLESRIYRLNQIAFRNVI